MCGYIHMYGDARAHDTTSREARSLATGAYLVCANGGRRAGGGGNKGEARARAGCSLHSHFLSHTHMQTHTHTYRQTDMHTTHTHTHTYARTHRPLHVALALAVEQIAALPATAFCDEATRAVDTLKVNETTVR